MNEDRLKSLNDIKAPDPSPEAKARALGLAMAAFDEKQEKEKNISRAAQGSDTARRPISITNWIKGFFSMDARFPIAATVTGLLLLPVGIFVYQNTSLTPLPPVSAPTIISGADKANDGRAAPTIQDDAVSQSISEAVSPARPPAQSGAVALEEAPGAAPLGTLVAPPPSPSPMVARRVLDNEAGFGQQKVTAGDQFAAFEENSVKAVVSEPVSTFSLDVDTASYAYVRRALNEGRLPDPQAVRIEELVNYFTYDYAAPSDVENPFSPAIEIVSTPWNANSKLMRIGIEGYQPADVERPPVNLVFLIDTSGSMEAPDKLPLLKRALSLLVDQLGENDLVSIVAYAGSAGTVLEPTAATNRTAIIDALDNLGAGGSTAGAQGIELAYRLAEQARIEGGINRVMLATDGDFNVGISSNEELKRFIEAKRESGTFLSVLGFGSGNLNDGLMQTLAQNGNGNAYYIDSFREARKVLVEEAGSTLMTIAKDVKIQIEFNPALIAEYRLIGYETRALAREDFNNDRVDAGDVGAGHTVTALYELTPVGAPGALIDPLRYGETVVVEGGEVTANEIGFFKLRYKLPNQDTSRLIETPITSDMVRDNIAEASDDTRFAAAVAAFGQKLRGSDYAGDMSWEKIRELAAGAKGADEQGYRAEFISLIDLAASLSQN